MSNILAQKCYQAVKNSQYWSQRTKENGRTISNLICPECGDKTAWANQQEPYSINCNRLSSCGARTKTRKLFNITVNFEKEYQASTSDPNKPARQYLKSRGINDETIKGLDFCYWKKTRAGCSGAVMFSVGNDKNGKQVFNGRLFSPPPGEGKTHNSGSTSGLYWRHPAKELDLSRPVTVCEGIIDALSLIQAGFQAIAVLSSGQDPKRLNGLEKYQLITAFDNDLAGSSATKKYIEVFESATSMMPPKGADWNDLLQRYGKKAPEYFKKNMEEFNFNAALASAEHAHSYANMYFEHHRNVPGLFSFDGCLWFAELRYRNEEPIPKTERVGLFTVEVLSYINIGTEKEKEYLYHLRVKPKQSRPIDCTANGKQLSSSKDIATFLLTTAKVNYEGKAGATTAFATMLTTTSAPEVRQAKHTGLAPDIEWYFFNDWAADQKGKIHQKDSNGFFNIGNNERMLPSAQAAEKSITPSQKPKTTPGQIYELFASAWGGNGSTAFAWSIASIFVNQIKEKISFFPYLDCSGDPGAGKSAMVMKLQALQGFNTEGLNISETSTKKGIARKIHGLSGLFCGLLEFTEDSDKALGFINLLSAYNKGGGEMVQAQFTNTLETKDTPLLCSLLFCQNKAPFKNQQEKQRAVSLHFSAENATASTRQIYEQLNAIPEGDIASIIVEVLRRRKDFEERWYDEYLSARADLETIPTERIRCNHALILAFNRLFCDLFDTENEIYTAIEAIALEKEKTSAEREIDESNIFFEMIFNLETDQLSKYWHEIDDPKKTNHNSLYFSCTELIRLIQGTGQMPPRMTDLKKALKDHPAYIGHGQNHNFPNPPSMAKMGPLHQRRKAWHFNLKRFIETETPPTQDK